MNYSSIVVFLIFFWAYKPMPDRSLKLVLDSKTHTRVDTLYTFDDNLSTSFLFSVTDSYGLGNIDFYLVISKTKLNKQTLSYKILSATGFSKNYIAKMKANVNPNWGWFHVRDGKILSELPFSRHLLDSIKQNLSSDINIVKYGDKFIWTQANKTIKTLDYGNLVTKFRDTDFDNLDYNFYKLQGDSLVTISNNGDDILKQKNGIFFIPRPGYGIIEKYSIKEIIIAIDSVSRLSLPPRSLEIKEIR